VKKQILVVDDDQEIVDLLQFNLEHAGFAVRTAANGNDALKIAREKTPDLVLLDLMLPGINGFTVCETLRREAATARVPVVMLTAMPGQFCKLFGFEVGVSEFLEKPFSVQTLLARIRSLLETRLVTAL
jgi:two-component system alkaline phosphatase synthesis response regulator PhoP